MMDGRMLIWRGDWIVCIIPIAVGRGGDGGLNETSMKCNFRGSLIFGKFIK